MSLSEEQTECPLCMEPLELDDINFYPCTCGYQICRFCWHRIRTDENGLCPACRKQYPEDPAQFKPLTEDELQRIKKDRRQKDLQRKQKAAENRKHLANVRVVQKNLVFVVGLSQRLAEPEVLRKHEYFGKFGKIHKVVINQSTSYAGAQVSKGPSASAYVTYNRPEDALRSIQAVNNIHVDGRTLKASLGTTKYCSHFLRGSQCPKPDCMYLHELGEEAASFTKEEMQQGKHQDYEQKLYEQFMNTQNLSNHHNTAPTNVPGKLQIGSAKDETGSAPTNNVVPPQSGANNDRHTPHYSPPPIQPVPPAPPVAPLATTAPTIVTSALSSQSLLSSSPQSVTPNTQQQVQKPVPTTAPVVVPSLSSLDIAHHSPGGVSTAGTVGGGVVTSSSSSNNIRKLPFINSTNPDTSMSLFSSSGFPTHRSQKPRVQAAPEDSSVPPPPPAEIPDTIPVSSSTDWQAAFGFTSNTESHDDDLGFDPWDESTKALADLIEKEGIQNNYRPGGAPYPPAALLNHHYLQHMNQLQHPPHMMSGAPTPVDTAGMAPKNLPPGFSANHFGAFTANPMTLHGMTLHGSKMLGMMQLPSVPSYFPPPNTYHDVLSDISLADKRDGVSTNSHTHESMKDWQDGLRALLPNINISFGTSQQTQPPMSHSPTAQVPNNIPPQKGRPASPTVSPTNNMPPQKGRPASPTVSPTNDIPPQKGRPASPTVSPTNNILPQKGRPASPTVSPTNNIPPEKDRFTSPTVSPTNNMPPQKGRPTSPTVSPTNDIPPQKGRPTSPTVSPTNNIPPQKGRPASPTVSPTNDIPPQKGRPASPTVSPTNNILPQKGRPASPTVSPTNNIPPEKDRFTSPTVSPTNNMPPQKGRPTSPTVSPTNDIPPQKGRPTSPTVSPTNNIPPQKGRPASPTVSPTNDIPPQKGRPASPTVSPTNNIPPQKGRPASPTVSPTNDIPPQKGRPASPTVSPTNNIPPQKGRPASPTVSPTNNMPPQKGRPTSPTVSPTNNIPPQKGRPTSPTVSPTNDIPPQKGRPTSPTVSPTNNIPPQKGRPASPTVSPTNDIPPQKGRPASPTVSPTNNIPPQKGRPASPTVSPTNNIPPQKGRPASPTVSPTNNIPPQKGRPASPTVSPTNNIPPQKDTVIAVCLQIGPNCCISRRCPVIPPLSRLAL
ncbi:CCR4-NOT transcription complex subunit 4 [Lamellibrachia satsuma]|nr:CCR4-NOT transcription complex subunit 4 [Lamellibrachia satsuma]